MTINRIAVCAGLSIIGVLSLSAYNIYWAVVAAISVLFTIFIVCINPY